MSAFLSQTQSLHEELEEHPPEQSPKNIVQSTLQVESSKHFLTGNPMSKSPNAFVSPKIEAKPISNTKTARKLIQNLIMSNLL
jgi:hypothetical protein